MIAQIIVDGGRSFREGGGDRIKPSIRAKGKRSDCAVIKHHYLALNMKNYLSSRYISRRYSPLT